MYNAISKASRSGKPIPVSRALRDEIVHWLLLDTWDGFLPWKNEKHSSITLSSDASDVGWGGSIRVPGKEDQLIRGYWDESSRDLPIAVREAKALLYTLESLDASVANSRLDCFIDNKAVVATWQKQASKNPVLSQVMICDPPYDNMSYQTSSFSETGFQKSFQRVSKPLKPGFQRVSKGFPTGFQRVSNEFPKGFQRVSKGFPKGFQRVPKAFLKCPSASERVCKLLESCTKPSLRTRTTTAVTKKT